MEFVLTYILVCIMVEEVGERSKSFAGGHHQADGGGGEEDVATALAFLHGRHQLHRQQLWGEDVNMPTCGRRLVVNEPPSSGNPNTFL